MFTRIAAITLVIVFLLVVVGASMSAVGGLKPSTVLPASPIQEKETVVITAYMDQGNVVIENHANDPRVIEVFLGQDNNPLVSIYSGCEVQPGETKVCGVASGTVQNIVLIAAKTGEASEMFTFPISPVQVTVAPTNVSRPGLLNSSVGTNTARTVVFEMVYTSVRQRIVYIDSDGFIRGWRPTSPQEVTNAVIVVLVVIVVIVAIVLFFRGFISLMKANWGAPSYGTHKSSTVFGPDGNTITQMSGLSRSINVVLDEDGFPSKSLALFQKAGEMRKIIGDAPRSDHVWLWKNRG